MTKKRKTGLAIGLASACITVMCATGACNGIAKEEKAVHPIVTASTTTITTTPPTTTIPVTTTAVTTAIATTEPQITTATISLTAEAITTEQTTATDTTVPLTTTAVPVVTAAPAVTTAPAPTEPHNGQTSGDYIYVNGFGWILNEGGGGEGSVNYEMYCNGNKIGYFG